MLVGGGGGFPGPPSLGSAQAGGLLGLGFETIGEAQVSLLVRILFPQFIYSSLVDRHGGKNYHLKLRWSS